MFVIVGQSPKGPRLSRSSRWRVLDAIRIATAMRDADCINITITDLRDGKPMPLDWWQAAVATISSERV